MTLPVPSFAALAAGNQPASLLDQNFAALGAASVIACSATGSNAVALTPLTNYWTPTAYTDSSPAFSWIQQANPVGAVTINVAGLGALNAYKQSGAAVAAGDLIANQSYSAVYNHTLNSGAGGFIVNVLAVITTGGGITDAPSDGNLYGRQNAAWSIVSPVLWKNIKTDYGAKGDGVTYDSAAFLAFQTWAQQQTVAVMLVIPPGTYRLTRSYAGPTQLPGGGDFFRGIKELIIWGYGATLTNLGRLMPYDQNPANPPIGDAPLPRARIAYVQAGATQVSVIPPSPASPSTSVVSTVAALNLHVGDWVTVAALEMTGIGAPGSHYYFEYAQVAAFDTVGNTITFRDPLTNTYLNTYPPTIDPASGPTQDDYGGPAQVFTMTQDWDQNVTVMGVTFYPDFYFPGSSDTAARDCGICCRIGRYIDCTMFNPSSVAAGSGAMLSVTIGKEYIYERCNLGQFMEPDKNISVLKFLNTFCEFIQFSSMSYEKLLVDGCHFGTCLYIPKNSQFHNSNISVMTLQGGGSAVAATCIMDNCTIGSLNEYNSTIGYISLSTLSFANGRFFIARVLTPSNYTALRTIYQTITPGRKMFFARAGSSKLNFGNPFLVLAIGDDGTNIWFDTTLPGSTLPVYSGSYGVPDRIASHPCERFSARSTTGDPQAVQLSQSTSFGHDAPLYSYLHVMYGADMAYLPVKRPLNIWGTLVSLTVNVIIADSGPNASLLLHPCGGNGTQYVSPTNLVTVYNPVIDLKTVGKRIITPTAVTGSVGADAMGAAPGAIWFAGDHSLNPYLALAAGGIASIAGQTATQMPLVEIEFVCDQGITKLAYNEVAHA